ncbi:MAG: outer membrane lipoprotein-sorting protein [Candidatus Bipolaricaulia bacterium]
MKATAVRALALATLFGLLVMPVGAQTPSAEQLMLQADDRFEGNDFSAQVKLINVEPDGRKSELVLEMKTKLREESRQTQKHRYKIVARVLSPEDVKGLAVLVWENVWPQLDDIWLYLPALKQTKKIVPENFRTPIFGSEFSFEELTEREPQKDTHQLVRTEKFMGKDAWVIKSISKTPDVDGFSYRLTWVVQEWLMPVRMELYDKNDKLLKRFIADEVKVIQGIPTRVKSTAENFITKRKSTFEFLEPTYDTGLSDELFDPKNLGK